MRRKEKTIMKVKDFINNPLVKKGLGIAGAVMMGIITMGDALASQRKEREYEEMKKIVSELRKQNGEG